MWYVIRVTTGKEEDVKGIMEKEIDNSLFDRIFIPKYENVWKKEGCGNISIEKMFPGYIFIDTEHIEEIFNQIKGLPVRANIIKDLEEEENYFIPLGDDEVNFFKNVLTDDLMTVSYIKKNVRKNTLKIYGPLQIYKNKITKLDIPHRRAIAEVSFLGKIRTIKFGLWTDADGKLDWIEDYKQKDIEEEAESDKWNIDKLLYKKKIEKLYKEESSKYDFKVGDMVSLDDELYQDTYIIKSINENNGTVKILVPMFGTEVPVDVDVSNIIS